MTYNNNGNSSNPTITSANTNTYNDPIGQVYVIAGTAGENLYDLKSKAEYIITQYKGFGFLNVDITNDGTKLIGTFYANEDGSVKDTFTITKSGDDELPLPLPVDLPAQEETDGLKLMDLMEEMKEETKAAVVVMMVVEMKDNFLLKD